MKNSLGDRYTDGILRNWPRWAHYLEKMLVGALSFAGCLWLFAETKFTPGGDWRIFTPYDMTPRKFALAALFSLGGYVAACLAEAQANDGSVFPLSKFATWHQMTKLALHTFPIAVSLFLVAPFWPAAIAVAVVVFWFSVAWPNDAG